MLKAALKTAGLLFAQGKFMPKRAICQMVCAFVKSVRERRCRYRVLTLVAYQPCRRGILGGAENGGSGSRAALSIKESRVLKIITGTSIRASLRSACDDCLGVPQPRAPRDDDRLGLPPLYAAASAAAPTPAVKVLCIKARAKAWDLPLPPTKEL